MLRRRKLRTGHVLSFLCPGIQPPYSHVAFIQILGQEKAINVLQKALRNQRVPQAYIFAGYEGVGKKLTALTLAKALNCHEQQEDSCDRCPSCHRIDGGNHPDVRVIEPEGQYIKIDQIRTLQKDAGYKPFEGRRKVYIIDQAEAMRAEAANALLKTLEEPSTDCVIILITANVYALLPTVISRCQFVRFVAVSTEKLVELLVRKKQIPREQARLIASLSEGCPGRALAMDTDEILEKRQRVEQVLQKLSSGLQDVRVLFDQAEELVRDKATLHEFLDILLVWYRDMYLLAHQGNPALIANSDALHQLRESADRLSADQIRRLFDTVYKTKVDILHNANLQLTLEIMLMSLTEVYNDRIRWR